MLSERQANLCVRLLARYAADCSAPASRGLSAVGILNCPRLRQMVHARCLGFFAATYVAAGTDVKAQRLLAGASAFVAEQFARYVRILRSCEQAPTPVNIQHSALLRWLLQGREPTPQPPPVLYSYPRHALATGEDAFPVHWSDEDGLVIGQNGCDFTWYDRSRRLVTHEPTGHLYCLTDGSIHRVGSRAANTLLPDGPTDGTNPHA